jgi:hypothetical protein
VVNDGVLPKSDFAAQAIRHREVTLSIGQEYGGIGRSGGGKFGGYDELTAPPVIDT